MGNNISTIEMDNSTMAMAVGATILTVSILPSIFSGVPTYKKPAVVSKRPTETPKESSIELRQYFRQGDTFSYQWRMAQLQGILRLIEENIDAMSAAAKSDINKPQADMFLEKQAMIADIKLMMKGLKGWMKPHAVGMPLWMMPGNSWVQADPLGTVLILGPWNYPFTLTLLPLAGALAAGNCAVVKPSELAPAQAAIIAELLPKYVDGRAVRVYTGGAALSEELVKQTWDKVFYTGGGVVGSLIAQQCAKTLTPVALELGGKSPCFIAKDAYLPAASKRIVQGKFVNAGQTCIAPDYVLVERAVLPQFIEAIKKQIVVNFGKDPQDSEFYCRIINDNHFKRVTNLLKGEDIVFGGGFDAATKYVAPTLVMVNDDSSELMTHEIFGPILPIRVIDSIDEGIDLVNSRPKPLALYVFTASSSVSNYVLNRTSSGSACVNDTVFQYLNPYLPFGGVGPSGQGAYHGESSFIEFSHKKSVLFKSNWFDAPLRYLPYVNQKWVQNIFEFLMGMG